MKGQTQAVTAVMITGIMVGTIAAVYVWGTPLLEKRESQAELSQVEGDVLSLKDSIQSVSNSGEGSGSEVEIRISDGEVLVNEDENYIEIITFSQNPAYPQGTWRILDGNSIQGLSFGSGDYGIRGRDSSGVVAARSRSSGDSDRVSYRVEFRNILDTDTQEMELVDLNSAGSETSTGQTTVSIRNQGTEQDQAEIGTGEEVSREKTLVRVRLS